MDIKEIWVNAAIEACKALINKSDAKENEDASKHIKDITYTAGVFADGIVLGYETRFGELAQIMKGIPRCSVCKKETNSHTAITVDGHNFCNEECATKFLQEENEK